jgi:galactokinase
MNRSDRLAAALADGGLPAEEIPAKQALFAAARTALRALGPTEPERLWFVPGRIEVSGKHTDYAGGRSLLATVPRGFAFAAARHGDGLIRVVDAAQGGVATFDPAALEEADDALGWRRYAGVVVRRLARNFPRTLLGARDAGGGHRGAPETYLGADLAFASDLPQAAGLSSSAALTAGLAIALVRLAELDELPAWRATIRTSEDLAGYLASIENGSSFGALAGDAGVGALSGSEDPTAILCCRPGRLSQYSFLPVRPLGSVAVPAGWTFVAATSGVAAEKAAGAREFYNRAALGIQALLDLRREILPGPAGEGRPEAPLSLAAALASTAEAEGRLREQIQRRAIDGWTAAELERRLTHFLREDARTPLLAQAFAATDAAQLGELALDAQRDAESLLGNQIPETVALAELARAHGAFAAASFGAGFGGSVWALVERAAAADFGRRWHAAYRERFPQHAAASWFAAAPGPGLQELTLAAPAAAPSP